MNVNGITNASATYGNYEPKAKTTTEKPVDAAVESKADSGVVYEPSKQEPADSSKKIYKQDTALINKLKAEVDARTEQFRSLVEKLIMGQGNAIGTADDIWSFLRKGDFTVDAATKAQAQADIAEDGYWGVEQTSDRLVEFAKGLAGNDTAFADELLAAMKKGFEQATGEWGDKLPDICQRTIDAAEKKMIAWRDGKENVQE